METRYEAHDQVYKSRNRDKEAGWDQSSEAYEVFQKEVDQFLNGPNAPKSGKVLELGCGAGNMSVWLCEKGFKVYGIDIAETAIQWARDRAEKMNLDIDFKLGSVLELADYEDEFFDYVFDSHLLHCIIGEDRAQLLKNVNRVLKPGGYMTIHTMSGPVDEERHAQQKDWVPYDPESKCAVSNGIATRYFGDPGDILDELRQAGFEVLSHILNTHDDYIIHNLHAEARKRHTY